MTRQGFPILWQSFRLETIQRETIKRGGDVVVVAVPWNMIEPHQAQAKTNHSQTLERLAARGGLNVIETLAVLEDREWRPMEPAIANAILASKITLWREAEVRKLWTAADMEEMGNALCREAAQKAEREYLERVANSLNEDDPAREEIERSLDDR